MFWQWAGAIVLGLAMIFAIVLLLGAALVIRPFLPPLEKHPHLRRVK